MACSEPPRRACWNSYQPKSANLASTRAVRAVSSQRFLSLFLRSEREIFRYVAALVPNVTDAEDIVQQTAIALWEKFDTYDPAHLSLPGLAGSR